MYSHSVFIKRFTRNFHTLIGSSVTLAAILMALLGPFIGLKDPTERDLTQVYKPPLSRDQDHQIIWLGTDGLGRDILSRIVHGAAISLKVGVVCVTIALALGGLMGVIAGYYGGWADQLLMRFNDLILSFPSILLAIVIVSILGPSLTNAIIAVAVISTPQYARLLRGSVLEEKSKDYVQAAKALGSTDLRLILRTVLPNSLNPIIIQAALGFATAILDAAGLSFLGLGAQPPTPEWGAMLNDGMSAYRRAYWVVTFPGLAIFMTVLCLNLLGDGLRELLDPRMKR